MANPDHFAILQQGVATWNEWRSHLPPNGLYVKPDLRNAKLSGVDLTEAFLNSADLSSADLSDARLAGATLHEADLSQANLRGANFLKANLRNANLSGADLTDANFLHADLRDANLREAIFPTGTRFLEADLRGANLGSTSLNHRVFCKVDLRGADLSFALLRGANLRGANLSEANLEGARLVGAKLERANLSWARLVGANLNMARLQETDLRHANLGRANLRHANMSRALCVEADFTEAVFIRTNFEHADLTGAHVYGISAWDLQLNGAVQRDLVIRTPPYRDEPIITLTVDDLEIAQFIYLLLHNDRVRKVIDTITSKVVLILGRFTPERKAVLDAVREQIRNRDYLPIVFDFEKPCNRDLTETVSILAHMAKFVIADLTDAKSLPQELGRIIPSLPSVPVQPILLTTEREWGMYEHFARFPWVLPIVVYATTDELLVNLAEKVIGPAEQRLTAADAAV